MQEFVAQYNPMSFGLSVDLYPATSQINRMLEVLSDKRRRLKRLLQNYKTDDTSAAEYTTLLTEVESFSAAYEAIRILGESTLTKPVSSQRASAQKETCQEILSTAQVRRFAVFTSSDTIFKIIANWLLLTFRFCGNLS